METPHLNSESHPANEGRPVRLIEPLVQSDAFRARTDGRAPLPDFAAVAGHLPEPALPAHSGLAEAYRSAWATVWAALQQPPAGSALMGPLLAGRIQMDESAFVARLAGYSFPAFDLIHLLDNFYASQHDDGFIARELELHQGNSCFPAFDPNSTGPNLFAWTEWRHYRLTGDEQRLRDVFGSIAAYHRWLRLHRTWQSGLYWTTGYASGNVQQPCVPDGAFHHRHWTWLEATLQANVSGLLLGRMAEMLEKGDLAAELSAERSVLGRRINSLLWDDAGKFYLDANPEGDVSEIRTLAAFWALLDRQLVPDDRRQALIQALRQEHLSRSKAANGTAAADSADGQAPVDIEPIRRTPLTTYVALRGLQSSGSWLLAHEIALDTLNGDAAGSANATPSSAALLILMVLEQVIGLSIDWPLRQIAWRNYLGHGAETGVRHVALGQDGTADLLAADGVLTVTTDTPFTLSYRDREQEFQSAVPAGVSTFDLG